MLNSAFKALLIGPIILMGACGPGGNNYVLKSQNPEEGATPSFRPRKTRQPEISSELKNEDFESLLRDLMNGRNQQQQPGIQRPADIFRVYTSDKIKDTFADVVGLEDAKDALKNIIDHLQDPVSFRRLGAKPPMGVIFYGPPGTGKTAIARAFAGEVGKARKVSFIVASGASFENKYVGVGADNVRKLFELARRNKPAIIFIDEFDAVAGKRSQESKNIQMVNQLLTELDGFDAKDRDDIFLVAATNLLKNIDPAVKRAGRIDRKIEIPLPHQNARKAIIEYYLALEPKITGIDLASLVTQTDGWNAADLEAMVNEARIHATMNKADRVETKDFSPAIAKINQGRSPN